MRKLRTDYIDLVLLHQPFGDYYGAWRALEDLYEEGKLRAIGISNFYPDRISSIDNRLTQKSIGYTACIEFIIMHIRKVNCQRVTEILEASHFE